MLFYEIKIHYTRQTGEDNPGVVKETYLVEGLNCSDVEGRLIEEIKPYIFNGDVEVTSCRKVQLFDLIPSAEGDRWFKARVELITVEDNGKETRKAVTILICASTIKHALKNLAEHLSSLDCEIVSITRSPIMDVLRATN